MVHQAHFSSPGKGLQDLGAFVLFHIHDRTPRRDLAEPAGAKIRTSLMALLRATSWRRLSHLFALLIVHAPRARGEVDQ